MKRKGYRERYFEDYIVEKKIKPNGKSGVDYIYSGIWYQWGLDGFNFAGRRLLYCILETVSIVLYALVSVQNVPFNSYTLAAGFGILSVVAWALEIWGIVSFSLSKTYITELDYKAIDFRITMGAFIRVILLILSIVCGTVKGLREGSMDIRSWIICMGFAASCAVSGVICRLQSKQGYRTYKNVNGQAEQEI